MKFQVCTCWDDGVLNDERLVSLLRRHAANETFNINPGFMGEVLIKIHKTEVQLRGDTTHTSGKNFKTIILTRTISVEVDGQRTCSGGDGRNLVGYAGGRLVSLQNLIGGAHAIVDGQAIPSAAFSHQGTANLHEAARLVRIDYQIGIN